MRLLQVDQSRGGRGTSSDVQEGHGPQAQPTVHPTAPEPPATVPTSETHGTESRHAGASAALSGAGRDLERVTGTPGAPIPAGARPTGSSRPAFEQGSM